MHSALAETRHPQREVMQGKTQLLRRIFFFIIACPQATQKSHTLLFIVLQKPYVLSMGLYEYHHGYE